MSFLEALEPYGLDFSAPGAATMARGLIIANRVGLGWSNNAIQRELSSNGLGISVGQLDPMVRAERARQAAGPTANQLGVDYSTGELLPGVAPEGWTGQYVHQVTTVFRTRDTSGAYQLHTRSMWVKANDPLTPDEAASDALGILTAEPEEGEEPTGPELSQVLTTTLTGVWYDVRGSSRAA